MIVPAHTFIASALAVAHVGATPVLCDVDRGHGPDRSRRRPGGQSARVRRRSWPSICMARCATWTRSTRSRSRAACSCSRTPPRRTGRSTSGRRAGSLGDAAAFSFYPSKNLGALGDGGAVCTDDELLAARLRRLRNLGQRAKGEHVELGYNERLDGLQAALLRVKLPHLDALERGAARARRAATGELLRAGRHAARGAAREPVRLSPVPCAVREPRCGRSGAARARASRPASITARRCTDIPRSRASASVTARFRTREAWAAEELSLPMHPDLTRR